MYIEVLVSTMNREKFDFIKKMNIKTDCVVINQYNKNLEENIEVENTRVKFITNKDRGLSKSRNLAIGNSEAEICIIADDDLVYKDEYYDIVNDTYKLNKDADIIVFDVPSTNINRPTSKIRKDGEIGYLNSMKVSSFQITFKRESLIKNGIRFNEKFGAGSKYSMGEENILLWEALNKGLKIVYSKNVIATVTHEESSWFKGFDKKYLMDKGAVFTQMSQKLSLILIIQFIIRKYNLYKQNISFLEAARFMLLGRKSYLKDNKKDKFKLGEA